MARFNGIEVTPRFNRPNFLGLTYLEHVQLDNGSYSQPFFVSSVHVFRDLDGKPDRWLDLSAGSDRYGLIKDDLLGSSSVLANFAANAAGELLDENQFDPSPSGIASVSGIYGLGTGRLGVILDPSIYENMVDQPVGNFFDVWTMWNFAQSKPVTHVHKFGLYNDTVIAIDEPLMLTTKSRMLNKYINQGSKVNLKIENEYFSTNRNIPDDIKNIFRDSVVRDARINIIKLNNSTTGPAYDVIREWKEVDSVTSDDTLVYMFDTANMEPGSYQVQAKFTILDETLLTDTFSLVLR